MLLAFRVSNYRSIREEAVLDLEATGLSDKKEDLIPYKNTEYLPVVAVYGKNGGGKSNLIRAFWLAVQFILNAQRTQYDGAEIPVRPFELDDESKNKPTSFEFEYVMENVRYWYAFSATRKEIMRESLFWAPKGQKAEIFTREYQEFHFPANKDKKMKEMITNAVAGNQLFFAVATVMNYAPCIQAMKWFRTQVFFSRDYSDIKENIISHGEDKEMLQSIISMAKAADIGIADMSFEINNTVIKDLEHLPESLTQSQRDEIRKAFIQFRKSLSGDVENRAFLQLNELKATSFHQGINASGEKKNYPLKLEDESDGTIKLMSRAVAIKEALRAGGVLVIDEIEMQLHPLLVQYIIQQFQNQRGTSRAQLIFTTHSTEIMRRDLLRRDQYYFADKNEDSGATELYSLADFSLRKEESIDKAYLLGKFGAIPYIEEE